MYFTDEVKIKIENGDKYINEFKILNNIGHGSFSKVKKVLRQWNDPEDNTPQKEKLFAMKVSCIQSLLLFCIDDAQASALKAESSQVLRKGGNGDYH